VAYVTEKKRRREEEKKRRREEEMTRSYREVEKEGGGGNGMLRVRDVEMHHAGYQGLQLERRREAEEPSQLSYRASRVL